MRSDDPHPFIHRLRASGMADAVIYQRLLLEGWGEEVVAPIFAARGLEEAQAAAASAAAQAPRFAVRSGLILLGVFFLSAAAAGAVFYLRAPAVYSISLPPADASSTASALSYGALPALADPAYYARVKTKLIEEHVSFIAADLSAMRLALYQGGEEALSVPIMAKGKAGSWWETPVGIYKVETREKSHFSSFGQVYQPWSMQFQGNFFIHGIPTYEDGTPVSSSYSGGCIRLATADAQRVFDLARVGMPVIVYDAHDAPDSFSYALKAPPVSAQEYLVADIGTGAVLAGADTAKPAPIASITKLMTALVATEYINLDKELSVPPEALVYTTIPRLKVGERVRAYDLLYILLQESSNEAAETLASAVGREEFVRHMNEKARAIGLPGAHFTDPSGAKEDSVSPQDLFTLLRYIEGNRRFVLDLSAGTLKDSAYGESVFRNLNNFNVVKRAPGRFVGGKVGQTLEAGETYAGIFTLSIGAQERDIAVIVLGSRDAQRDVTSLLSFVARSYAAGDVP